MNEDTNTGAEAPEAENIETTDNAEATGGKSIIPSKYAAAYKERGPDWVGDKIAENCVDVTKNDKGKETSALDVDRLFDLAKANNIDTAKYEEQVDRPNAPGRLRMTIGNMLRARVKRRHGMFNANGKWSNAPEAFLEAIGAEDKPTEKRDGEKIAKPKPPKAETPTAEDLAETDEAAAA